MSWGFYTVWSFQPQKQWKMTLTFFLEPQRTSLFVLFEPQNKEKYQVFTLKNMEAANIWYFWLKKIGFWLYLWSATVIQCCWVFFYILLWPHSTVVLLFHCHHTVEGFTGNDAACNPALLFAISSDRLLIAVTQLYQLNTVAADGNWTCPTPHSSK